MIRKNSKRKIKKNPREKTKLQESLIKYIDKKIDFYDNYDAVGIIEFLENEKRLIKDFSQVHDLKMFVAHGLNHIAILCKEMFDLIKKEG